MDIDGAREHVRALDPEVLITFGSFSTDTFPYRYWESFTLPHWNFSVDISVDCKRIASGVELSADIATSEGFVLASYSSETIEDSLEGNEKERRLTSWVEGLREFFSKSADLVVKRLREA